LYSEQHDDTTMSTASIGNAQLPASADGHHHLGMTHDDADDYLDMTTMAVTPPNPLDVQPRLQRQPHHSHSKRAAAPMPTTTTTTVH